MERVPYERGRTARRAFVALCLVLGTSGSGAAFAAAPFAVGGPGVDPNDFEITTFATGLSFPASMQRLEDGSLVVLTTAPNGLFGPSEGRILRLVDADADGVADGPPQLLASGLPGVATSIRIAGELVFVSAQERGNEGIHVLRRGAAHGDPYTWLGAIELSFSIACAGATFWVHPNNALAVRTLAPGVVELYFNLGSEENLETCGTITASGLLSGPLDAASIYRVRVTDGGGVPVLTQLEKIASGLRNAAGLAFHPATGDLYFEDNGANQPPPGDFDEALAADELNRIAAADLGGAVEDFGFPSDYVVYRSGGATTGTSIQPLAAFQPIPDPNTGAEAEGPVEIAFAPVGFPALFQGGVFVGFHGRFDLAGAANEENPLVFADPATGSYFHFIDNQEPGIGHPNGLLATQDALFVADFSTTGTLGSTDFGAIYRIRATAPTPVPTLGPWGWAALAVGVAAALRRRRLRLLAVLWLFATACADPAPHGLVLISIDTLRADHVGAYGGPVATPMLDALAAQGVLLEHATTPTPTTAPATASMLTGLYPWHHQLVNNASALDARLVSLAEIARDAGMRTAGFVSNYMLDRRFGFAQGFDTYLFEPSTRHEFPSLEEAGAGQWQAGRGFWAPADAMTRAASAWIEEHASDPRRFFLWVHYFDPHAPYAPPAAYVLDPDTPVDLSGKRLPPEVPSAERLAELIRAYRGEVRFVDAEIARLLDALERAHSLDRLAIVVTADHGEGLGDHGELDHGAVLFDEAVRVPWIMRAPGLPAGARLRGAAQLEDLLPTLAALLELPVPDGIDGVDLLPWLAGEVPHSPRRASVGALRLMFHPTLPLFYERRWPVKWIGPSTGGGKLYDLEGDPGEIRSLRSARAPDFVARALERGRFIPVRESDLDAESLRGLRALGYID